MGRRMRAAAQKTSFANEKERFVILYGLDEQSVPRAGRYAAAQVPAEVDIYKRAELDVVAWGPILDVVPAGAIGDGGKPSLEQVDPGMIDQITAAATSTSRDAPVSALEVSPPDILTDPWQKVGVGAVVLVQESLKDGWWEAVVTKVVGDELSLRWRDYNGFPVVRRQRSQIALLHAPVVATPTVGSAN